MSTHTDGAPPSVGIGPSARAPSDQPAGTGDAPPAATRPPRPRRPSPVPADEEDAGETEATPAGSPEDTGGSRRAAGSGDGSAGADQGWLQQEIARRIAEKGVSDTGRHARPDIAEAAAPHPAPETPARPAAPPAAPPSATDNPAATEVPAATGDPADDEDDDDTRVPRAVPDRARSFRPRSAWTPDPYAPGGLREPRAGDGWPPSDDGTGPEPAFRLAGPAARPSPPQAAAADPSAAAPPSPAPPSPAPPSPAPRPAPSAPAPPAPAGPKQWPPATGAAGLPRRVPGAGWTLDRATLLGGPATRDTDPETRLVPATWTPAGRRTRTPDPLRDPLAFAPPDRSSAEDAELAGPPTTDLGSRVPVTADPAGFDAEDYDDDEDDDELDDEFDDLRGPAAERTEVIWRAPGLDDEPEPASRDAVVARPVEVAPSENPYTGARPRRFAGAPTDPDPVDPAAEEAADGPEGRRVRIVLSERRSTAQSVRPVVDVQDPGSVGTTLRNGLVSSQLGLAVRVFGVALMGLVLLPALFAAFPSIGELSVLGLRVPWLLLGFLVYPFLFGLGWWHVNSAERVEEDFVDGVQDR